MNQETTSFSLRESVKASISEFLSEEKFRTDVPEIRLGLVEVVNMIADYREEDVPLFPQVLLTTSPEILKSIPKTKVEIAASQSLTAKQFAFALKLCAPLAVDGWAIYLEISKGKLNFGIVNSEISETSPSLYAQAVGQMSPSATDARPLVLIRNIGQKTVELMGNRRRLEISLSLSDHDERSFSEVDELCDLAVSECEDEIKGPGKIFLQKCIEDSLRTGHGTLVGVVAESDDNFKRLKEKLGEKGGVYLTEPIDIAALVSNLESARDMENSVSLKNHASLLKSMLKHAGITVITTRMRIIGFHLLIGDYLKPDDAPDGGNRTKAFYSMMNCDAFVGCFFKSQDGKIKIWQKTTPS